MCRLSGTTLRYPPFFPLPRFDGKAPLLAVLVVPFVLQVIAAVGLTGYLSYCNGQQVISNLAGQLASGVGDRVEQRLSQHLQTPAEVTRNNAAIMQFELLDVNDRPILERYFKHQLKIFADVNSVALVDARNNFLAVVKRSGDLIALPASKTASHDELNRPSIESAETFLLPGLGSFNDLERQATESWFLAAKSAKKPLWRLSVRLTAAEEPSLTAMHLQPLYDRANRFQGVLAASASLSDLSRALQHLKIAETDRVFIVESNGLMVANSDDNQPFRRFLREKKRSELTPVDVLPATVAPPSVVAYRRLNAVSSHDFLTQQAASSVVERFKSFDRIQSRQQFRLDVDRQRYFVYVEPIGRDQNLNWLAVVVLSEADFAEAISANNRLTLWLCIGTLITATLLGWLTSSWIARPILRLSRASRELALGEWHYPVEDDSRVAELEVLVHSFNQMAVHLQKSLDQVKIALQESEAKFTKVFRASPDAITIALLFARRYIDVNDRFLEFTGYTREEVIGQSAVSLNLPANPAQVDRFEQLLRTHHRVRDVEIDYRNKQGQLRTVLVSSDIIELEGQTCLLSIYRDITERKQAEAALFESEQRFRSAFDTTAVAMSLAAPDGRFLQVNASFCKMLGYSEAELLTLTFQEITDPDDLDATMASVQRLLAGEISYHHLKKRYLHKDGRRIWCLLSVSLVRGRKQQPLYLVAQMQVMTYPYY
ncbi:PAS domain S-box protein [Leptolyngbya sp. FACHB-321]|uniref:PAS domain S-box protein n=1 Tax=Leptolyngbya sp. FACHB-321 TaxID=2692807 RepID=UPI0016872DEE|nr:PAS domain S-box protein [Leptolyngbya sp. FACHB-321]MBD2033779.1 PAS domain S-box protein [Leptolyngbya sp. FACHB-321]